MAAPSFTPRPGRFRQTPPAAFTPVFGFLGLGLAWRRGIGDFGLDPGLAEVLLGAGVALYLFTLAAYGVKLAYRPGVLAEDLRVLPGRGGLTAASLSVFLLAAAAVPYSHALAQGLLYAGFAVHAALALAYARALMTAPPEGRAVTPIWHLAFVGFIVGAVPATMLGMSGLASAILWATIPVALAIWLLSALAFARRSVPPPLRPLLAIHAAPAALFTTVAAGSGHSALATVFAVILAVMLVLLLAGLRWLLAAGFSPLWGAFTFPVAAAATAFLARDGAFGLMGDLTLIAATLVVLPILFRVLKLWMGGQLGPKTNAAVA